MKLCREETAVGARSRTDQHMIALLFSRSGMKRRRFVCRNCGSGLLPPEHASERFPGWCNLCEQNHDDRQRVEEDIARIAKRVEMDGHRVTMAAFLSEAGVQRYTSSPTGLRHFNRHLIIWETSGQASELRWLVKSLLPYWKRVNRRVLDPATGRP